MSKFTYVTSCVGADGDDINEMKDAPLSIEIDKSDFFRTIGSGIKDQIVDIFELNNIQEFIDDWHTSSYTSCYQGIPCLFVQHSGIEHFFVDSNRVRELRHGEEIEERRDAISDIEDLLDEYQSWQDAQGKTEWFKALSCFVKENKAQFDAHNILLSSIYTSGYPYSEVIAEIDKKLLIEPSSKERESGLNL
ncbi:hypothetical protein [Vibrio metschnikovii]|uniref:Uncharacterized protein n=1 Tax=Vibrio metschnikovii TaxID=28172 RepID=A0A9X0RAY9_VIBME|nr:hypothetical protein [Vibrio metschnikovii]MBC5851130.1 hypothetical protein [Vibrio metschnikovii]